jgi:hypothetical protein
VSTLTIRCAHCGAVNDDKGRAALLDALKAIANISGNLSDEAIQKVGGINDARALALKVVHARSIARAAIDAAGGET